MDRVNEILILSAYTKEVVWNNYGKCDFGEFATLNHKEYAEKYGYSYHCEISDVKNYPNVHPTWLKIYIIDKFLSLYDYVVWLDADAVYVNMEISIESIIGEDNPSIIVTKMPEDTENHRVWTGISTGFMIFKNDINSRNVLQEMLGYNGPLKANNGFHEQELLSNMILALYSKEFPDNDISWYTSKEDIESPLIIEKYGIKILPGRYQRLYRRLNTEFIFHAGGDTPTKLSRIKNAIKENKMLNVNYNYRDGAFVEITGESSNAEMFDISLIDPTGGENMTSKWELPVNHWVRSTKKYFVPWTIKINNKNGEEIFSNEMLLKGKNVFIKLEVADTISAETITELFVVLDQFRKKHECTLYTKFSNTNTLAFPDIVITDVENIEDPKYHAVYRIGIFKLDDKLDIAYHTEAMYSIWDPTYSIVLVAEDILGLR